MTTAEQPDSRLLVRGPLLLFAIWCLWASLLLAFSLRAGDALMTDPDDFMRMAQVRDWMAGQSWFDVTQYRINPPDGGAMHWSRLLDVPIAGGIAFFGLFLPSHTAEHATILILPLLLLGLLMGLVYKTVKQLADEKAALVAAFLLPTFPLIIRQFMPGRIDHHSWQILMAALAMCALFDRNPKRGAMVMAFALAFWMHVSIEGLPYVVVFGVILAAAYIFPSFGFNAENENRLIHFVNALTAFSAVILVLTQSRANLALAHCDAISWPIIAALTVVSAGLSATHYLLKPRKLPMRIVALGIVAAAGAAAFLGFSGSCALDPFGQITPLVREFWHETISEGLALHKQAAALIALLLFVPALFVLWTAKVLRSESNLAVRTQWLVLAALVTLPTLLSFKVQRTAGVAELFALPGIAALVVLAVTRIGQSPNMLVRVFGTVAAIVALSPMTAFVAGDALFAARSAPEKLPLKKTTKRGCILSELGQLPTGLIYTTMAAGPEILYRTKHSVFVSGYHRNAAAMDRLIATMLGSPANAQAELERVKPDYVVFCPTHFEAQSYVKSSKSGFAASLMGSAQPDWLVPVPAFVQSEMRVYRFNRNAGGN